MSVTEESEGPRFVLDTSAILTGLEFGNEVYLPSSVAEEARRKGSDAWTEALLTTRARILEPTREEMERVLDAARKTGDEMELSQADRDVLALALQLDAIVITDDYSIQNVAKTMGIEYRPALLPGIRDHVGWSFRCTGCGRYWPRNNTPCPICGSTVRRYRRKDKGRGNRE